jgi:hypothetical protein
VTEGRKVMLKTPLKRFVNLTEQGIVERRKV